MTELRRSPCLRPDRAGTLVARLRVCSDNLISLCDLTHWHVPVEVVLRPGRREPRPPTTCGQVADGARGSCARPNPGVNGTAIAAWSGSVDSIRVTATW